MKVFSYTYYEKWGAGQGIVIAESIEDAIKMFHNYYSYVPSIEESFPELEFGEIDITKPQVIDYSWCE